MLLVLLHQTGGEAALPQVREAGLSRDGEAGRDGQPHAGHLREVGSFATQEVLHLPVALGEVVNVLRRVAAGHEPPSVTPVWRAKVYPPGAGARLRRERAHWLPRMAIMSELPPQLQSLRESIPMLESSVYLASCSQGPLSTRVEGAVRSFLDTWNTAGLGWEQWGRQVESARAGFAAMINAQPEDVAVGTSMSQLVSSVVSAYVRERRAPRRRIVSSLGEFPGVAHAWLLDPLRQTLEVLSLESGRWAQLDAHEGRVSVRAAPFDAIELELDALWI